MSIPIEQDQRFTSLDNDTRQIIKALLEIIEALPIVKTQLEEMRKTTQMAFRNEAEEYSRTKAELHILASLSFPTMTDRYDTIPEAHRQTFEWIFRDPEERTETWSNFCQWAESGTGVYWINGKAGSGKSTLMRFIVDHPQAQELLGKWAPGQSLEMAAFFFWKSGVLEQRSQAGLLRMILHNVLQKRKDLISVVFSDQWPKTLELSRHQVTATAEQWSLSKLQKSFKQLVECSCEKFKFCFFIDGLDEYEGNHEEISDYFSSLSGSPFVKFCISSRPLVVFKDFFGGCPGLRLQDLTYNDIHDYTVDKLSGHRRMKLLVKENPEEAGELVKRVLYQAEGVFLWVRLVVDSLLTGLSKRDDIPLLIKRLHAFPSDLEPLYDYMMSSIEPVYVEECFKMFQIFEATTAVGTRAYYSENWAPSIEVMYIATIVDLKRVMNTPTEDLQKAKKESVSLSDSNLHVYSTNPASMDPGSFHYEPLITSIYDLDSLYEYMENRLRTHCGGLIECNLYPGRSRWYSELSYIHRSAADYLNREDIRDRLCGHTNNLARSGFDPHLQLLMSLLLIFKRVLLQQELEPKIILQIIRNHWDNFSVHIWRLGTAISDQETFRVLLNEFDRIATILRQRSGMDEEMHLTPSQHWTSHLLPASWESNFFCEAITESLFTYIRAEVGSSRVLPPRESGLPFLAFAFFTNPMNIHVSEKFEMIELLLELGADPNEAFQSHTIWEYFVHYLHAVRYWPPVLAPLKRTVRLFLERGVPLDFCCINDPKVWNCVYTAREDPKPQTDYPGIEYLRKKFVRHSKDEHTRGRRSSQEAGELKRLHPSSSVKAKGSKSLLGSSPMIEPELPKEQRSFKERHSLTAVLKDCLETKDDPHGADELLELIAKLREEKNQLQAAQHQVEAGPSEKKKARRRNKRGNRGGKSSKE